MCYVKPLSLKNSSLISKADVQEYKTSVPIVFTLSAHIGIFQDEATILSGFIILFYVF